MNCILHLCMEASLQMFQTSILKVEADHITATEASQVYKELVVELEERKVANFMPFAAKQLLKKLNNEEAVDQMKEETFMKSVERFYASGISYLKLWENSFDKANDFKWITLQHVPTWDEVEDSSSTVASVVSDAINMDELFDERSSLVEVINNLKPQ
uniref:Uncharacterized protein n=1 Tax=Graphocephala atropunctata TaxID=36148 RepID=A0A1B6L648_9HEMI